MSKAALYTSLKTILLCLAGPFMLAACETTASQQSGFASPAAVSRLPVTFDPIIVERWGAVLSERCVELGEQRSQLREQASAALKAGDVRQADDLLAQADRVSAQIRNQCITVSPGFVAAPPFAPVAPQCLIIDCADPRFVEFPFQRRLFEEVVRAAGDPSPQPNLDLLPPTIAPYDLQLQATEETLVAFRTQMKELEARRDILKELASEQ